MSTWPEPPPRRAQISRVPYLPGLDGLRALAVVAVMIYHANSNWLHGGFLGVEVFFVISGYLITLLIVAEHERTGHVNLGQFWLRRFRRLLPALYVMLIALGVYMALFYRAPLGKTRGDFLAGILYSSNWYQIWVGQGYGDSEAFAPLRHLWSLAVEEQFYLIWPLVMIAVVTRFRRQLPKVGLWFFGLSIAITVAVAVLFEPGDVYNQVDQFGRKVCGPGLSNGYWTVAGRCISVNDTLYLSSVSRSAGLLLGAGFALLWRPMAIMRSSLRRRGRQIDIIGLIGLIAIGYMMHTFRLSGPGVEQGIRFDARLFRGGFFLTGLATLLVVAAATHQRAMMGKVLGNPLLHWIGTRSYGLYLYHWPIYQIIRQQAGVKMSLGQFVTALAFAVPITELSYRCIETPIRQGKLSEWFRGERRPPNAEEAKKRQLAVLASTVAVGLMFFAIVSFGFAKNVCVGDLECDLATARAEALQNTTTSPSSVAGPIAETTVPQSTLVGQTIAPTLVPPTTIPATTTTLPVDLIPPLAIGESVMAGALPELRAGGINPNAEESRGPNKVIDVLGLAALSGQIGRTVVIQVGTNGSVSDAQFDQMMALLPGDRVTRVVFMTVRAPLSSAPWTADNNIRIRGLAARYPTVRIADWEQASQSIQLCKDNTHISCGDEMAQFYVNLILATITAP